jgi:hypothetical protein
LALSLALTVIGSVIGFYGMYVMLNPVKTCSTHAESGVTVEVCTTYPSIMKGFLLIGVMMVMFIVSGSLEPIFKGLTKPQEDDLE